jgi:hypothetical protein
MTVEQYIDSYESQGRKCYICGFEGKLHGSGASKADTLVLDHCHASGQYRGLLCNACNLALGHFRDDISRLEKAVEYLRKHNATA